MSCPKAIEELSAYVDGGLEPKAELSLRRHLDTCAFCQQKVKILSALKERVARSAEVHSVPHTLREHLSSRPRPSPWSFLHHPRAVKAYLQHLREQNNVTWSFLHRPRAVKAAFALVLILVVAGVAGWLWQRGGERKRYEEIAQVLVADHIHFLQVPDALEISSSEPAEVVAWFRDRVSFPVQIPHLNNARLLGGRLCSLLGQQVALVFYERGGKRLSLFTLAAEAISGGARKGQGTGQEHPRCLRTFENYSLCLVQSEKAVLAVVAEGPETEELALSLFRSFRERSL